MRRDLWLLVGLLGVIVLGLLMLLRCQGGALPAGPKPAVGAGDGHMPADAVSELGHPSEEGGILVGARVVVLDHAGVGTPAGDGLLERARAFKGRSIPEAELERLMADLSALQGRRQASVLSSPMVMARSGQSVEVSIGSVGRGSGSVLNLALDLACTAQPDGTVAGVFDLRVDLQQGPIEITLAELGLPGAIAQSSTWKDLQMPGRRCLGCASLRGAMTWGQR
ncbi:MAG: hypothetical protein Kow0022_07750 [Phycisphaerales bacterium]